MPEMTLEWRNWVNENIVRGVPEQELINILIANRFEQELAFRTVFETIQQHRPEDAGENTMILPVRSGFESRLPCDGVGKPWSVAMRLDKPCVVMYLNVLSHEECDRLIALSRPKLKISTTIDNKTGEAKAHEHRSSQGTFFKLRENDFIREIDERLAGIMNLPIENAEGLQILNYQVGGEYRPHFDYFPPEHPGSSLHIEKGGQRVATLILYLNDVEEGGETVLPEVSLKIAPLKGAALYFSYFHQGKVDPMTLHGGCPVVAGEKWIATKWVRESNYNKPE